VRMALGAGMRDVLRRVVVDGMKPTLVGVAVGLAAAFALTRVLGSLVFGVAAHDVVTFAAVALLLVAVGIYGLLAYFVVQHTPEIGVRLALGATPREIHRLVMRRSIAIATGGIGIGVLGALALTRFMQGLLFETSPTEPAIYFGVAVLLLVATAMACWVPARRATKVDPVIALRAE